MSVLPLIDEAIFPGHYILKQLEHIHVRRSIEPRDLGHSDNDVFLIFLKRSVCENGYLCH